MSIQFNDLDPSVRQYMIEEGIIPKQGALGTFSEEEERKIKERIAEQVAKFEKLVRPSLEDIYMNFAHKIALRSTCARAQVGAVITNRELTEVYAIGYNGNAKGLPNKCDSETPGNCGCLHAEQNALLKCNVRDKEKLLFLTMTPCYYCAKMIINSGFSKVYYARQYERYTESRKMLEEVGIETEELPLVKMEDRL